MSMETRRQEQDVKVYRCDTALETGRCVRETASFQCEGSVTVFTDTAWTVLRVGLGEERQFCSWDHMVAWLTRENAAALWIETGNTTDDGYGDFAVRLRNAARDRQAREDASAERTRALVAEQDRSADLLGML